MSPYRPPSRLRRKWLKLRRDPVRFFADTKIPLLRRVGLWVLARRYDHASEISDRITAGNQELGRWIIPLPRPRAPSVEAWRRLAAARPDRPRDAPAVDVIVPVYGGYDDTLACLFSVVSERQNTPHEVIVIDDCSPEAELSAELERLAGQGLFTLLRNDRNLGFVRSANRGMELHLDRDVVLLNSDTLVHGNWLDRLRSHAVAAADVATVTPLSNNATICSYPRPDRNNDTRLEIDGAGLDALAARVNVGRAVEAPTGIGFCMYVRRHCLDKAGLFDADRFGRGYGEENDLCQKAIRLGMRNLIATDVFVRHTGEVSFGDTAQRAQKKALRTINALYPHYHAKIRQYIARDPVAPARRALDLARLADAAGGANPVLFVTHSRGGGVERHIRDTIDTLRLGGTGAILLRSIQGRPGELTLNTADDLYLPNLNPVAQDGDVSALARLLREAGIARIAIHSLADWPAAATRQVPALARDLGVPYEFAVHDYLPVCPRTNLIDHSGLYCGEKGEEACRACLERGDTPCDTADIAAWRADYGALLAGAAFVFAPSGDAAQRIRRYFPGVAVAIRPHEERIAPPPGYRAPTREPGETLRIAVIGAIGPHKGSAVLLACARDALRRRLPLEFVIVGYSDRPELEHLPNVTLTGRYREDEVFDLIARHRCHMAFLPSVWPETYSYTLSIALAAGLPVAAFDIGAVAERLVSGKTGWLLPRHLAQQPARLADALVAFGRSDWIESSNKVADDKNRVRAAFASASPAGPNTALFLRPTRSTANYCTCFTPRSGSSWLAEMLTGTKLLGRPNEWFNPDHLPSILQSFGCNDVETYVEILQRRMRTPNGVFGMKISYFQLKQLEELARLDVLLGAGLKFLYLVRKDFVAQAISLYRAVETGYFHSVQSMTDAAAQKLENLPYDAEKIEQWALHILQQEYGFECMFHERGIAPLRLHYEALVECPAKTIQMIADHIGIEDPVPPVESGHGRLAGETSGIWASRFRAERRDFVLEWTKLRGHRAAW